jgi:hypothetical protein
MFDLALTLADDDSDEVVRAAVGAVACEARDPFELPDGWLQRLVKTRAALQVPDEIIDLAARRGIPSTAAVLILECAHRFVDAQSSAAPPHWDFSRQMSVDALCSHLAQLIEEESRARNGRSDVARDALAVWERLLQEFPRLTVGRTRTFVG